MAMQQPLSSCFCKIGTSHLSMLESMRSMKELELRGNHLRQLDFLEMNHELCWLGVAKNKLKVIAHLQHLSNLAVLDISDNSISRLQGLEGLTGLKALIAARNRIRHVDGLSPKKNANLETLVLSHNHISECNLAKYKNLKKLSLGHNALRTVPKLVHLPSLSELRLNSNKITTLSGVLQALPKLSIFDIGNNLVTELSGLEPLRGLLWVKSLNVLGNPVTEHANEMKDLIASLPKLEIVNDKRQSGTSKKKRKRDDRPSEVVVHGRAFEGTRAVFDDSDVEAGASTPVATSAFKRKIAPEIAQSEEFVKSAFTRKSPANTKSAFTRKSAPESTNTVSSSLPKGKRQKQFSQAGDGQGTACSSSEPQPGHDKKQTSTKLKKRGKPKVEGECGVHDKVKKKKKTPFVEADAGMEGIAGKPKSKKLRKKTCA